MGAGILNVSTHGHSSPLPGLRPRSLFIGSHANKAAVAAAQTRRSGATHATRADASLTTIGQPR